VIENWANLYATAFATQSALNPFLSGGGNENANALGNTNLIYQWGGGCEDRPPPLLEDGSCWRTWATTASTTRWTSSIGNSEEKRAELRLRQAALRKSRLSYGVARQRTARVDFDETPAHSEAFTNRLSRAEICTSGWR
jgi:hypothetical protein